MAATVTLYDHTRAGILSGYIYYGDAFRVNFYTVLPVNASATTKAEAEVGATPVADENGYEHDAYELNDVSVEQVGDSNAIWDAEDFAITASGGPISAAFAMIYDDNIENGFPVLRIDFGETKTANDGEDLLIEWAQDGIFLLS